MTWQAVLVAVLTLFVHVALANFVWSGVARWRLLAQASRRYMESGELYASAAEKYYDSARKFAQDASQDLAEAKKLRMVTPPAQKGST